MHVADYFLTGYGYGDQGGGLEDIKDNFILKFDSVKKHVEISITGRIRVRIR